MNTFERYWKLLANYLRSQRARVILLAALILSHIGLQLISPQIVRFFIDTASAGSAPERLVLPALLFLGVSIVGQALALGVAYLGQNVAWMATNALRLDLTRHCLRLDMSFHKTHTPGELIERIDGDVGTLANFFSQMALRLVSNGLLVMGILVVLFVEDWRVGLVGTIYISLAAMLLRQVQRPATRAWGDSRQAHAELFGFLGEQIAHGTREQGEFQLTSALERLRQEDGFLGLVMEGQCYDIGLPESYLRTWQAFGLRSRQ